MHPYLQWYYLMDYFSCHSGTTIQIKKWNSINISEANLMAPPNQYPSLLLQKMVIATFISNILGYFCPFLNLI